MLADLLFDIALSGSLKIITSPWRVLAEGAKAVRRVAEVARSTPGEKLTPVEYFDALLFPEDDRHSPR
jgi:hypothetical protein